ncbi:hypothetical protein [Nocardia carnea]|uniref:hypothetical protein n=1 Tax=Nocardia carnea TaxID=37328 RepID=UPI002457DCD5|nr:hypothetical protein [Nocardia carnea]
MGAGVTLADEIEKEHDDTGWNDIDNDKVDEHLDKIKELNSTEFNAFFERLPGETRNELLNSADGGDRNLHTTDEYREIYNALKNGEDREKYVQKLQTEEKKVENDDFANGAGGQAPLGEGEYLVDKDGNGLVSLHIPRGATPMLTELVEDTQFAMQEGLKSLGSGDPESWLKFGFTNMLAGSDIESADGWSNVINQHAQKKGELDERATEYTQKHKDVEIHTWETKVFKDELWKQLLNIKDGLNNDRLKLDLAAVGYEKRDDNRIILTGDIENYDPNKEDDKPGGYTNMPVNGANGERVLYRKNVQGDAMTAERGFKGEDDPSKEGEEQFYYLTPEAEWHFYVQHIDQAAEDWDKKYRAALERMQRGAHMIDDDKGGDEDKDGKGTYDDGYKAGLEAGRKENPGPTTPGPTTPGPTTPGPTTPGATTPGAKTPGAEETQDFSKTFDDLLGKEDPADGTGNETGKDGKDGKGGSALEQVLQPIRDAITGSGATGATAAGAPAGDGGMGVMMPMMMMGMMSQMMQQAMQQQKQDEAAERDREEREREDEEPQSAPAPNAGPAPAAPAAPPPGTTAPPVQTDTPPAPPAPDTPKSMVDMKLPDGSSQRVSSVVSEAINRELNNPNGSDARAAYQGTPGEATAGSPWVSVESSAVATGDIAQWENRSALVVVTDSGLQAIVNGQMVPLDPHNPPDGGQGGYGEFRGFFHPSGADISGTNETAVGATPPEPPAIATAAPPAAAAAPPAVPPPATMEVR